MARLPSSPSLVIGMISAVVLGLIWGTVFWHLPVRRGFQVVNTAEAPTPSAENVLDTPSQPSNNEGTASSRSSDNTPAPSRETTPAKTPQSAMRAVLPKPRPQIPEPLNEASRKGLSPNCMAELEQLCQDVRPGIGRRKCFQENERKLSMGCQQQIEGMAMRIKKEVQYFKTACAADARQFCRTIQPGGGRILQCLEDHLQEVSDDCYVALRARR